MAEGAYKCRHNSLDPRQLSPADAGKKHDFLARLGKTANLNDTWHKTQFSANNSQRNNAK